MFSNLWLAPCYSQDSKLSNTKKQEIITCFSLQNQCLNIVLLSGLKLENKFITLIPLFNFKDPKNYFPDLESSQDFFWCLECSSSNVIKIHQQKADKFKNKSYQFWGLVQPTGILQFQFIFNQYSDAEFEGKTSDYYLFISVAEFAVM